MKNTFGSDLSLTIFGESHGRAVGAVLDGMAAGVPVDESFLAACMDKRRARGDGLSTPRVEADAVQLLSGVVNGHTTGTAIALMIENQNTRSGDYAKTADLLRPGHADYTAYAKYHGYQDARGGGHFSGRVTAALVAGGALVLGALNRAGIEIVTHIGRCAGISDAPFALDDPAALAAQAEALLNKSEGFALLDGSVEEPMKAAIRAAGALLAKRGYVDDSYADAMVEREKLVSTYMGMGVAIPHGTSQKKGTVKKSGVVLLQYPQGVDFGDEKAYLVFGIAGVGNDHLDLLGNVCEILEDEDALEQLKTTSDMNYVLEHLQ